MLRNSQRTAVLSPASLAALVLALCSPFLACRQQPPPELPPEAGVLVGNQKWEEAIPVIKKHLLVRPDDVAAHFYLGQCYLNMPKAALAAAEGEFQIALSLFQGKAVTTQTAGMSPNDFEVRCYLEIADTYIRSLRFASRVNAGVEVMEHLIQSLDSATKGAARIAPEDPRVKRIEEFLDFIQKGRKPEQQQESETRI